MEVYQLGTKWHEKVLKNTIDLIDTSTRFKSNIFIEQEGAKANASSYLELLLLTASPKDVGQIVAEGEDEKLAIESIVKIFN